MYTEKEKMNLTWKYIWVCIAAILTGISLNFLIYKFNYPPKIIIEDIIFAFLLVMFMPRITIWYVEKLDEKKVKV